MKRPIIAAFATFALAILVYTVWRVVPETQVGKPDGGDLEVSFKAEQGDYAVYTGGGSAYYKWAGSRGKSAQFTAEVTALAMDKDLLGGRRLGVFRDVKFPKDSDELQSAFSFMSTPLSIQQISAPKQKVDLSQYPMGLGVPLITDQPLKLGQEWEARFDTDTAMWARVIWRVAGEETVNGFRCLRIDLTPKIPPPYEYELKDRAIYDGPPSGKIVLTGFKGHAWVDKKTGWVVKIDRYLAVQEDEGRSSEMSSRLSLSLKQLKKLTAQEYATLSTQFDRLDYIQSYWRNGGGWPGRYNLQADSDTGEQMLREFHSEWPKSRFNPFLSHMDKLFQSQRRYAVNNVKFEKPFTELHNKPAPSFKGAYLDGKPFTPEKLRGKPAVMILPSTNRDYVRYRADGIERFTRKWQKKGVQVVGVARQGDTRQLTESFIKRYGFTFPFVVPEYIPSGPLSNRLDYLYRIHGLLTVIVLDAKGNVRHYRADLYPAEVEPLLGRLL